MPADADAHQISKFLSLVLRHKPEMIGLVLDENGWTDVPTLLHALSRRQMTLSLDELRHVVTTNNKQRFAFNDDFSRIRASQGHSVEVDLGYREKQPPARLYHGTTVRYVGDILEEGLKKINRHHVHLSADEATAIAVGERRGKPVVLGIRAGDMAAAGHQFFQSANGVWLTDHVPVEFIERGVD